MKVKMKVSIAGIDFSYQVRQVVDLDDDLARKWIEVGHCEAVEAGKETATRPTPENTMSLKARTRKRTPRKKK